MEWLEKVGESSSIISCFPVFDCKNVESETNETSFRPLWSKTVNDPKPLSKSDPSSLSVVEQEMNKERQLSLGQCENCNQITHHVFYSLLNLKHTDSTLWKTYWIWIEKSMLNQKVASLLGSIITSKSFRNAEWTVMNELVRGKTSGEKRVDHDPILFEIVLPAKFTDIIRVLSLIEMPSINPKKKRIFLTNDSDKHSSSTATKEGSQSPELLSRKEKGNNNKRKKEKTKGDGSGSDSE